MYALTWGLAGLFLLTTAAVALATPELPRWLGWSAVLLGAMLILGMAAPSSDISQIPPFLFLVWTIATGTVLMRRSQQPRADMVSRHASRPSTAG